MQIHQAIKATAKLFFVRLTVSALLLLPLTGWLVVKIQGPQVEREAYVNLAVIAKLKTDQIENWLDERRKNGPLLSADTEFTRHVAKLLKPSPPRGRDHEAVAQRLSQLRQAYDYDSIELLDRDGRVLASSPEHATASLTIGSMVRPVQAAGSILRPELRVNGLGQAQLEWLLPVFDAGVPQRQPIALMLMRIAPERFLFPVIQTWPTSSPSGETLLVNREGDMAVFMNELRHRSGTAMKLRLPIIDKSLPASVALESNQSGIVSGTDYRGVAVLTAYRPVAGTAWRVVAKIDHAEVLAPVRALAWWVSGVTLLAIMALALVLTLFLRQIRRAQRLEVLAEKARLDQQLLHKSQTLESVRPFALALIASDLDIDRILQRLVQKLEQLLPSNLGAAWLLDRSASHLCPSAHPSLAKMFDLASAAAAVVPGSEAWGRVAFSPADARTLELSDSPLRSNFNAMVRQTGLTACWSVPVRSSAGQVLGVLDMHRKHEGELEAHEIKLIALVTEFFGLAIERKASEAQERLAGQVFSQSLDGITITDAQGNIVLVNPAFSAITGYSAEEVLGLNPRILSSGRHGTEFYADMWRSIQLQGMWQGEIWNRRKSGEIYPEWLTISRMNNVDSEPIHYISTFSDISQRKADEERIEWMAHFDHLTGLPNRALLDDRVAQAISMAQRRGESIALLFMDLDNFKHINDSLGHDIGDEVLVGTARRMRRQVREQDTLARTGGDEFVLVMPGTDADGAAHLAQKLLDSISKPLRVAHHELSVTPSVGIAMYPQDGRDFDSLVQHADVAMYRAKQDGRNAYRFFAPDMQSHSARTLLLEGALRRALERNQLSLHYQP